jgi:uncharacterized protein (DUF885 family)
MGLMPTPAELLTTLGDALLDVRYTAEPVAASMMGVPGYGHLMADPSPDAAAHLGRQLCDLAAQAEAIDGSALTPQERTSRGVLVHQARTAADVAALREVEFSTAPFGAAPQYVVLSAVPKVLLPDREHAEAYLQRLHAIPGFLDEAARSLVAGTKAGRTSAQRSVERSIEVLDELLGSDLADDPLLSPTSGEGPAWHEQREVVVRDEVRPALARLRDAYRHDLLPHARGDDRIGVGWLPDGEQVYATLARAHTTTSLSPQQLHELGLAELDRLDAEFAELGAQLFGTPDREQTLTRMRQDPLLRLNDADELVRMSEAALTRATAALPDWFGLLPPSECDLQVIPEAEARNAAPAFYTPPDDHTGRPGTYWVNTHEITQRPRYDVETILFHEANPGHHLQLSIAQKLDDLPLFRRVSLSTAYVEGWGLYTERLADEMGLYGSELDRLGMLSADSWRACRLVVDSGLHGLGWSWQRAVDFMALRTALPLSVIEPEVDRYVGMPGQALGYMVGRLEIMRMRQETEATLGPAFCIKDFHDVVLRGGSLPLDVLAQEVRSLHPA